MGIGFSARSPEPKKWAVIRSAGHHKKETERDQDPALTTAKA